MRIIDKTEIRSLNIAVGKAMGIQSIPDDFDDEELIGCQPEAYSDALFVVKRRQYELGRIPAHVMDTDLFDMDWQVIFQGEEKAPRERVKQAIVLVILARYGIDVGSGMKPDAFEIGTAIRFMKAIADIGKGAQLGRNTLTAVYEESFEIASTLARNSEMQKILGAQSKVSISKL